MSVEKVPNRAANGANTVKSAGLVKSGQSSQEAGDSLGPSGGFSALLSGLGVDDPEISTVSGGVANPDEQIQNDAGNGGSQSDTYIPTIPAPAQVGIDTGLISDTSAAKSPNTSIAAPGKKPEPRSLGQLSQDEGAQALAAGDGAEALVTVLAPRMTLVPSLEPSQQAGVAGKKPESRSLGHLSRGEGAQALAAGDSGPKAARSLKERVRVEITHTGAVTTASAINLATAVIPREPGKVEIRGSGEKTDASIRVLEPVMTQVLSLEASQQTEFRREKAIFKEVSSGSSSDIGNLNNADARPASLSLEGMSPDVGSGTTQGDQNPGTYWMSSDLKNAEMKLDGFGESPVEVSISVHGNQTHVAFRTDETQTRIALEDAGATLKEMLNKEGLDLTGVSVGTSGSGGDGAQNRRPRPDSRPVLIENISSKFQAGTSGNLVASQVGKLDVYV